MKYLRLINTENEFLNVSNSLNDLKAITYIGNIRKVRYPLKVDDTIAMYYGQRKRNKWGKSELDCVVTHLYADGHRSWFFPTFLYLEFNDESSQVVFGDFQPGHFEPAKRSNWEWLLDRYFSEDSNNGDYEGLRALDECIESHKAMLGLPPFKHKVMLGVPCPAYNFTDWNDVQGEDILDMSLTADRLKSVKWFIDEAISRFSNASYTNIDLIGFYWIDETMGMTIWTKLTDGFIVTSDGKDREYWYDSTYEENGTTYHRWIFYKGNVNKEESVYTVSKTPAAKDVVYKINSGTGNLEIYKDSSNNNVKVQLFLHWTQRRVSGSYDYVKVNNVRIDPDILNDISEYLHSKNLKFLWIPFNGAYHSDDMTWRANGFDRCDMQTGYMWKTPDYIAGKYSFENCTAMTKQVLDKICQQAQEKKMGIEFELSHKLFTPCYAKKKSELTQNYEESPYTFVNSNGLTQERIEELISNGYVYYAYNPTFLSRLNTLVAIFDKNELFRKSNITYYLDGHSIIELSNSNELPIKNFTDDLARRVYIRNFKNK